MIHSDSSPEKREYLERIPFVSEILKRIDDISQAIRQGGDGIDETLNLLSDLPDSWSIELKESLDKAKTQYNRELDHLNAQCMKGCPVSQKEKAYHKKIMLGREYSRSVKQIVITSLDKKNLLFLTRREVPEEVYLDVRDTAPQ